MFSKVLQSSENNTKKLVQQDEPKQNMLYDCFVWMYNVSGATNFEYTPYHALQKQRSFTVIHLVRTLRTLVTLWFLCTGAYMHMQVFCGHIVTNA